MTLTYAIGWSKGVSVATLGLCGFVLGACAPVVTSVPVALQLPPGEMADYPVGSQWVGLEGSDLVTHFLIRADAQTRSLESTTGCSWTQPINFLGPALEWEDCKGSSGRQVIQETFGEIWPLEIGKTQSWSVSGKSSTGETWKGMHTCRVDSAERVTVPAGDFDTFKVTCESISTIETTYYAPSLRDAVLYLRVDKARADLEEVWQYMSGPTFVARGS